MIKLQPFQKIKQSLVLKPTIWQASVPPDLCHSAEGCLCCPLSKRFFIVSSAASFGVHVPMRPSCWRERAWTPFKKKTRSYTPSHALNLSAPCCSETLNSVRLSACSSYTHHTLDLELPEPLMLMSPAVQCQAWGYCKARALEAGIFLALVLCCGSI